MSQSTPTISIALCTYNGAAYLREQLGSIAAQSTLPLEVVITDDRSTDNTVDIARAFADTAPFPVHVHINETTLGVARNFGKAIGECTGDIIALADQDDIWRVDKLAVLTERFAADPQLCLVFTDADLVDQSGRRMNQKLSDTGHIDSSLRRKIQSEAAFETLLRKNVATGATVAFRRELTSIVLPIPDKLLTYHDAWLVPLAAATGRIDFLPEPLIQYRQHPGQHTWDFVYVHGARRVLNKAYYQAHLAQLMAMRDRLRGAGKLPIDAPAIIYLDGYIEHLRRRSTLPAHKVARVAPIVAELATGRYTTYSSGLRSAARDLIAKPE